MSKDPMNEAYDAWLVTLGVVGLSMATKNLDFHLQPYRLWKFGRGSYRLNDAG